jgi:hypothetical protein
MHIYEVRPRKDHRGADSLNRWIQIALSNSKNAVRFSSACTTNRWPSPRCASTIQIVRPLESIAETQPQLHPTIPLPKCRTIQHNSHSASCTLFMNNDTKARWDEARREQFGATATTVFALASAAVAYISSLLTEDKAQFGGAATCFFLWTVITFIISLGLGVAAMVTRLEDFRATAHRSCVCDIQATQKTKLLLSAFEIERRVSGRRVTFCFMVRSPSS